MFSSVRDANDVNALAKGTLRKLCIFDEQRSAQLHEAHELLMALLLVSFYSTLVYYGTDMAS